jgi:ribosome maturation factor RimP
MGAPAPIRFEGDMFVQEEIVSTSVYGKERSLLKEVRPRVERGVPGIEVLALELLGRERFRVYVDHPDGVTHALCERVTNVLRDYLDEYTVEVSSPGLDRPLRTPSHFERAVGRRVALRTEGEFGGRTRFRGELLEAGARTLKIAAAGAEPVDIPYEAIVRGNLIDEG